MVENISQKYYVKLNTICNVRINTIKWDVPSPRMNENEVGDKANELTNPIFIPIKEYNVTYSQSQKRRFLDLISNGQQKSDEIWYKNTSDAVRKYPGWKLALELISV